MSIRLRTASIRMRPPGGSWRAVATSIATAKAIAVGDVTISWGQPTPRDHPEPGSIAFTLLVPDGALDEELLAYDTEVIIEGQFDVWTASGWQQWRQLDLDPPGWNPVIAPLARGWLTRWTRSSRLRDDGRRSYSISCIDVLGRAAATRLAASPWPSGGTSEQRVAAINASSPSGPLLEAGSYVTGEAYDVDSAPALDVIRRHCPIAYSTGERIGGIQTWRRPNVNARYTDGEIWFTGLGGITLNPVQADMVEDTGREMDRTNVVSDVSVTAYWELETQRRTVTWRDPAVAYSSSKHSVDTDERITNNPYTGDQITATATWAKALIAESRTAARRLRAGHRIRLGLERIDDDCGDLFLLGPRAAARILDITDAPDDLDHFQYVTGGTLTIHGLDMTLTLDTFPARLFGVRPMRYIDLPRDSRRPRIRGTERTGITGFKRKTRLSDLHAISFAPWPGYLDYT